MIDTDSRVPTRSRYKHASWWFPTGQRITHCDASRNSSAVACFSHFSSEICWFGTHQNDQAASAQTAASAPKTAVAMSAFLSSNSPNPNTLFRRQIQLIPRLHAKGLIPSVHVPHRAVHPELSG